MIYLILNTVNYKAYIGKTSRPAGDRWDAHLQVAISGQGYALHNAIRKYGPEAFELYVLEADPGIHGDDFLEKFYIRYYGTIAPNGYNLTEGGEGILGYRWSPEQRRKKSLGMLGKQNAAGHTYNPNPETRVTLKRSAAKQWAAGRGWKPTDAIRKKQSDSARARGLSPRMPALGLHQRWHVNRGVMKPACGFCQGVVA